MKEFFKGFVQWIRDLFRSAVKFITGPEILYFDRYIRFKKAPLIGKLYQHENKIWRVVDYEIHKGRFKCQLELI